MPYCVGGWAEAVVVGAGGGDCDETGGEVDVVGGELGVDWVGGGTDPTGGVPVTKSGDF